MKQLLLIILAVFLLTGKLQSQVDVAGAHANSNGSYATLKDAFDAINPHDQAGADIIISISGNTAEAATAFLTAVGGIWNTLTISPSGGEARTISGNIAGALIYFDGAVNVTIDGLNADGNSLTISNTNTGTNASTLAFANGACNNTVTKCTILGSTTRSDININGRGIIWFGASTADLGNNNNTISFNNISNAGGNRPFNVVYSFGTNDKANTGNSITNNNIYDFFRPSAWSYGIHIRSNSTGFTISGNSFYETTTFAASSHGEYRIIYIENTSGNNFNISGNFIGGSSNSCGGDAWTKTNTFNNIFYAIYLGAGTTGISGIQDNTISNFSWANSHAASWYGIYVNAGTVHIGTSNGNTIGAATGTGSITFEGGTTGANFYGIYLNTNGASDCQNNTIGSINAEASDDTNATHFHGIFKTSGSGTTTITNNTIGSSATVNSIQASSAATANAQRVYGIYSEGTGLVTTSGNTIANMNNATTNPTATTAGLINGVTVTGGTNTITNNIIHDLTIASANIEMLNTASAVGIVVNTNSWAQTVSGNTIYQISNTYDDFVGTVIGLYYKGHTTASTVSRNFIHSLSVHPSSAGANIYGIRINAGATTYSNNIVTLGGNTQTTIYGIYETGAVSNNNNLYFNTLYIGGASTAGSRPSYALYSNASTNARNIRNNIFVNERSNSASADGKHFAVFTNYTVNTNLTINFNNYFVTGTGGVLGGRTATDYATLAAWQGSTSQDTHSKNLNANFLNAGGASAGDYLPSNSTLSGITAGGIIVDYSNSNRQYYSMGAWDYEVDNLPIYTVATSSMGRYSTLKEAFDGINDGTNTGVVNIWLLDNTTETATATLNASGSGNADFSAVTISPSGGGPRTISGNINGALVNLNGADNVTIDGLNSDVNSLTITNTHMGESASTIRFIGGSNDNTISNCTLLGSSSGGSSGVIFFSTGGNNNNSVSYCNISHSGSRPRNVIYSLGSSHVLNNIGNNIKNNNIYDFIRHNGASFGILMDSYSSDFTISGNSFYETSSFTASSDVEYRVIHLNSGNSHTISGNYIGGNEPGCGGDPWTKTERNTTFYAISTYSTAASIQGNTISNFNWANSGGALWCGMLIDGGATYIGTTVGNTIGAATGTGSITFIGGNSDALFYGIWIIPSVDVDCQNNTIGSITTAASAASNATSFRGIYQAGSGDAIYINNTIGSTTTANSILASSAATGAAQSVYGIGVYGIDPETPYSLTVSGNTIANLTNATTNTTTSTGGLINGIYVSINSTNSIINNTIRDLSIANANTGSGASASATGIHFSSIKASTQDVTGNTIYNISNTYSEFAGTVTGLFYSGPTTASTVSRNFIHSLGVNTSSTAANIYGIRINAGTTTYSNNIVSLGGNTQTTIYGIYETGAAGNNNSLYFNTVYISGNPAAGSRTSYALYSNASTNVRNFVNNILVNARSNVLDLGKHYAIFTNYTVNSALTIDYNDYFVSGTGGCLGGRTATDYPALDLWQGATSQDANSMNTNPQFNSAGGSAPDDYYSQATLSGTDQTGIEVDFYDTPRLRYQMGALDGLFKIWSGAHNTTWSNGDNWSGSSIPHSDDYIKIPGALTNYPLISNAEITASGISIATGASLKIAPSGKLTVNKNLNNLAGVNGLLIQSNATGTGSLIHNTANVPASIQRYIVGGGYHNVSVPLAEGSIPPVEDLFLHSYLFRFDAASTPQTYVGYGDFPFPIASNQGYLIWYTGGNTTYNHSGNLNNGSFTALTNSGPSGLGLGQERYNLVPNPYPSAIDWLAPTGWTKENLHNAVYVWNREESDIDNPRGQYASFVDGVGNMGGSRYIPVGQAFFVEASSAGNPMLQMDNGVRVHNEQPFLKHEKTIPDVLCIHAASSTGYDETVVRLNPLATEGFDGMFDARKLAGTATLPQLYTMSNDGHMLSINALPAQNEGATIVPLAIDWEYKGEISLSVSNFESFEPTTGIHLEDLAMNIIMSLRENQSYTFTHQSSTIHPRFRLHFNALLSLESLAARECYIWSYGNTVFISIPEISENQISVSIFDTMGKTILMHEGKSSTNPITVNLSYRGVVVARVIAGDKLFTRKLFIQ
jgi:hypothetical protein